MAIRGAPVLDEPALSPEQKMIADKLTVSELMSMAVIALPPIVRVRARCLARAPRPWGAPARRRDGRGADAAAWVGPTCGCQDCTICKASIAILYPCAPPRFVGVPHPHERRSPAWQRGASLSMQLAPSTAAVRHRSNSVTHKGATTSGPNSARH